MAARVFFWRRSKGASISKSSFARGTKWQNLCTFVPSVTRGLAGAGPGDVAFVLERGTARRTGEPTLHRKGSEMNSTKTAVLAAASLVAGLLTSLVVAGGDMSAAWKSPIFLSAVVLAAAAMLASLAQKRRGR